jgi:hypothetical protein
VKEYRVLAQSDSFWRDRFSPMTLEAELNKLARSGWRVVACTSTEFTGLGGLGQKRHELFVLLEREQHDQQSTPPIDDDESRSLYDASLIPAERWYQHLGNVSTVLQNAGVVTKEQMNAARAEFAKRGGHLCDHLLALGLVDDATLRAHFGR